MTDTGFAAQSGRERRQYALTDWALSAISMIGIATVALMLLTDSSPRPGGLRSSDDARGFALIGFTSSEARRRRHRTLVWEPVHTGASLYDRDALFVPQGSDVVVLFADGSRFDLDENTLVVLAASRPQEARLELARGSLSGQAGPYGVSVTTRGGTAKLSAGTLANVELGQDNEARVDVMAGRAALQTSSGSAELSPQQAGLLEANGKLIPTISRPVSLEHPSRGTRFFFQGEPRPIELRWSGPPLPGRLLEVAVRRSFTAPTVRTQAVGTAFTFKPPAAGTYYWRLVEPDGVPASGVGKFAVLQDNPPLLTSPHDGELVVVPPGEPVLFAWTSAPAAARYRLEIGRDRAFSQSRLIVESNDSQLWLHRALEEGTYFWRVCAADPERGDPPYSAVYRFRLLNKPLLAAPKLLDPKVEIE